MHTRTVAASVVALLIGFGGGYLVRGSGAPTEANMHSTMAGMTDNLEGKSGDAFDKTFLAEMTVHHQGAIEMAEAALERAGHAELKDMARAIIDAQTEEIAQMQAWLKDWY